MGIYFKDTGEQRPNFKRKGGTKTIMYLCSPISPGEQVNRYPVGVCWLKRQIWFHYANSEGSGESAHFSLA